MAALGALGIVIFLAASKKWGVVLTVGGTGGLIGEFIQSRLFLPRKLRHIFLQTKGRTDLTYTWNAEKLIFQSGHGNAERPWGDFLKAKENDQVFILYYNDALFEIISKRWFHDRQQIDDFRQNLKIVN